MLFHVSWEFIDNSEDGQGRTLGLFSKWQPGPGQFHAFYGYADGTGGLAIVEAADAATLTRTLAPWTPWLSFEAKVILPVQETAAINAEAAAWRAANS